METGSWVSSVEVEAGRTGVRTPPGIRDFFSLPKLPDWLWTPQNLLCNGYWGSFLGDKAAGESV